MSFTADHATLFCLPYAGGSAVMYEPWRRFAPPGLEICPLELPGRGRRVRERPLASIEELAADAVAGIIGRARPPLALFGHSMGATIAFECARILGRLGHDPAALFVSAQRAPQLAPTGPPIHGLDDEAFVAKICELGGTDAAAMELEELRELFLPVLRADFAATESYRYLPGPPLPCPVYAFAGAGDREVRPWRIRVWSERTTRGFRMRLLPGGHFFIHDTGPALIDVIAAALGLVTHEQPVIA